MTTPKAPKTRTVAEAKGKRIAQLRVIKKFAPHARGAKALTARYGEELVCIRHRVDATGRRRITTVELVVSVQAIQRKASPVVTVKILPQETALRARLEAAGGCWDYQRKAWRVRRATAMALGLKARIAAT